MFGPRPRPRGHNRPPASPDEDGLAHRGGESAMGSPTVLHGPAARSPGAEQVVPGGRQNRRMGIALPSQHVNGPGQLTECLHVIAFTGGRSA